MGWDCASPTVRHHQALTQKTFFCYLFQESVAAFCLFFWILCFLKQFKVRGRAAKAYFLSSIVLKPMTPNRLTAYEKTLLVAGLAV